MSDSLSVDGWLPKFRSVVSLDSISPSPWLKGPCQYVSWEPEWIIWRFSNQDALGEPPNRFTAQDLAFWKTIAQEGHQPRYSNEAFKNLWWYIQSTRPMPIVWVTGHWNSRVCHLWIKSAVSQNCSHSSTVIRHFPFSSASWHRV
jgi:hypothetical protein